MAIPAPSPKAHPAPIQAAPRKNRVEPNRKARQCRDFKIDVELSKTFGCSVSCSLEPGAIEDGAARTRGHSSSRRMLDTLSTTSHFPAKVVGGATMEGPLRESVLVGNLQASKKKTSVGTRYRQMQTSKSYRLANSAIQGLGLFATRDIYPGEMVIEYIGEVIGHRLADRREIQYELCRRGCYMFRLDDCRIIDASLRGNMARFINHSCDPNCVARNVRISNDIHVIIFASRFINAGEELAYDYKFAAEGVKVPCHCGASNCRRSMN